MSRKHGTAWVWVRCGAETFGTIGDQVREVFGKMKGVYSFQPVFSPGSREAFVRLEIVGGLKGCQQFDQRLCVSGKPWHVVEAPRWARSE